MIQMEQQPKVYYPLNNRLDTERPKEDPEIGPWNCVTIEDDDMFTDFLEIHRSEGRRGVCIVFRVSKFLAGEIRLGPCVILDREKATQVRDRLSALLGTLQEK